MRSPGRLALVALAGLAVLAALSWAVVATRTTAGPAAEHAARLPVLVNGLRAGGPPPTALATGTAPVTDGLAVIAQLGGAALDVAVAGDHAYVAQGSGLTVYDVRDAANPRPVGRLAPLAGVPAGVAVAGGFAYVATEDKSWWDETAGLQVVDVSDPTRLALAGQVTSLGGMADVVVADGRAYTSQSGRGGTEVRVLDLSDPARPNELGAVASSYPSRRIAIEGSNLYTASDVVDVSDPAHPRLVEPFLPTTDVYPSDMAPAGTVVGFTGSSLDVTNNLAYIRRAAQGATPVTVDSFDCHHDALGIARFAGRFLVVGLDGGCVFEVPADGSVPVTWEFPAPGRGTAVTVQGGVGYVAINTDWSLGPNAEDAYLVYGGGLQTLDLTEPTRPRALTTVAGPSGFVTAVAGEGERLYVADGNDWIDVRRLWILDGRDPAVAAPLGVAPLDSPSNGGLAVANGLVYLTTYDGLQIWDVSAPATPELLGAAEILWGGGFRPYRVFPRGDFAYVLVDEREVQTLDVTDPTQPRLIEPTEADAADDFVAGPADVGYRVTSAGLEAVRLGGGRPTPLGPPLDLAADRLAVAGTTVYALDTVGPPGRRPDIEVIDASDPTRLRRVTTLANALPSAEFDQIVAAGDRLYAASPTEVLGWDITDPLAPRPAGRIDLPTFGRDSHLTSGPNVLAPWGDRVMLGGNPGGVTVIAPAR